MENSTIRMNALQVQTIHNSTSVNLNSSIASLPFRGLFNYFFDVAGPLSILLLAFGTVANILNIIVFTKIGAKDNVTVSFLALTVSDLMHLVLMSPHIVTSTLHHIENRLGVSIEWLFDALILRNPFYWYAFVFYETSILITVYISVVRCACVAMPLKVKSTFTVRRAIIAFIAFFISMALLRVPMFMSKRIVREFDTMTNATRVVYKEIEDGGLADLINDIVSRNILTWTSFTIVVTCVVVMVTKLRASANFRSSASVSTPGSKPASNGDDPTHTDVSIVTTDHSEAPQSQEPPDLNSTPPKTPTGHSVSTQNTNPKPNLHFLQPTKTTSNPKPQRPSMKTKALAVENSTSSSSSKAKTQVLSARETQVVRSVVLVAVVFITCQVPFMAYSLVRRFESQFDDFSQSGIPKYIYLFAFSANLSKLFSTLNASVNIFVYYNFNSRYRQCMQSLCATNTS